MQPQLPKFLCMSWEWFFFYMIYLSLSVICLPPFPRLNAYKKDTFSKKHLDNCVLKSWDRNLNFWYTFSYKLLYSDEPRTVFINGNKIFFSQLIFVVMLAWVTCIKNQHIHKSKKTSKTTTKKTHPKKQENPHFINS